MFNLFSSSCSGSHLLELEFGGLLDNLLQHVMLVHQHLDLLLQLRDLDASVLVVSLKFFLVHNARLLLQLQVDLLKLFFVLFQLALLALLRVQLLFQVFEFRILNLVLRYHILKLLSCMGELYHILRDLLPELVQFFVSLFDLFIKSLVLNLELFEIDKMETIC